MVTIKQYREAIKALEINSADTKRIKKEADDKLRKTSLKYLLIINNIEREKYSDKAKIMDKRDSNLNPLKEEQKTLLGVRKDYKRLMAFISLIQKIKRLDYPVLYHYKGNAKHYYEPMGVLVDDEYKKFSIYIVKNEKPKNCYSLVLAGNTVFNTDILPLENTFGVFLHSYHVNVLKGLKDASTKEELEIYFDEVRNKLILSLKEQFALAEKEYTEVEEMGKQKTWKIAHVEYQLDYYKNCYSGGTERSEYKALEKQLKKLNAK